MEKRKIPKKLYSNVLRCKKTFFCLNFDLIWMKSEKGRHFGFGRRMDERGD